MGILSILENVLVPSRRSKEQQEVLKEIFCKRKGDGFIDRFNTSVAGTEYTNPDGSDRQECIKKLKVGEKVRLIWQTKAEGNREVIYLVRRGGRQQISMPDCFGRLNDKTAGDVIRWMTHDNIVTAAKVVKILGGTRKRPKLGCVVQLTTYPGPQ